jgi:hypothetical protein
MQILPLIERWIELLFYVIGDYAGDMQPEPDTSHEKDMAVLFNSSNYDAEMEATEIHSILESNGIPSVLVGSSTLPNLEFEVQVPRERLEEARQILAEAQAAGPGAAAEAEAAGEEDAPNPNAT